MARRRKAPPPRNGSSGAGFGFFAFLACLGLLASLGGGWVTGKQAPTPQSTSVSQAAPRVEPPVVYAALSSPATVERSPDALPGQPPASTIVEPAPPEPCPIAGQRRKITGHKVPLRSEPLVGSALVDRLEPNQVVTVLEQRDGWARVKVERTQRNGWVPAKRVGDAAASEEPEKKTPKIAPVLAAAVIAKLLIEASIADYPGPCACPYQHTRNGSSCGRRAAYSRPGGYAPLCFEKDVTPDMIAAYRASH